MSARVALKLPPLELADHLIPRSGFRWTCQDGQPCKAGDMLAFCSISIRSSNGQMRPRAFLDERFEFQAALILNIDGVVHHGQESSQGGFIDYLPQFNCWDADFVLGFLAPDKPGDTHEAPLRLMLGAGRRVTEQAGFWSGFLSGWHVRSRAWWADGAGVEGTLLGVGSCEVSSIIVGNEAPFSGVLRKAPGFAHVVMQPDLIVAPCSRITVEQTQRTPEQERAISDAFSVEMAALSPPPTPADWITGSIIISALLERPLETETPLLSRCGLQKMSRPNALFISLSGESRRLFRHRRLGYTLNLYRFRLEGFSPAILAWVRDNFEPLMRDADEIKSDLLALIARVKAAPSTMVIMLNAMSTNGNEEMFSYSPFDPPMGRTLASVNNKELNLVLHDLARDEGLSIIDQDAIAADMGAQRHLPDGAHQSGQLQQALREELLWTLEQRRIPGFCRPAQTTSKLTASAATASPS